MKSLNTKLFALAATLAIAATTASAQATLKAGIPFAFEVGGHHVLQAGNYAVSRHGDVWFFANQETRNKVMAPAIVRTQGKRNETARLVFECRGNNCSLRNIQTGDGSTGAYWPAPKRSKSDADELAQTVVVRLAPSAE